ncbi:MAG: aminopeptidase P family protein [Coriobacteriia bacterium]|nr:aminopeptidase P family protein [Coriobacteriia bacterium]MBN2822634.1 aminopeptidase P family protein [Coriobacteriia bacterium]
MAEHRLEALRRRLVAEDVPAIVVSSVSNLRYLTGFEGVIDSGINAACLVTQDKAWFYTDRRYSEASKTAAVGTSWELHVQKESLYVELCEDLKAMGIGVLAVESSVPYGRFQFISEQFFGSVKVIDGWLEEIRQVKTDDELDCIARAAALTDRAFEHVLGFVRPGRTEREVALELEFFARRNGSDGVAFDFIVAGGPNSAHPHAGVTDRPVQAGEFLKMDFGARVNGYCSDMTRTLVIGPATDRHREMYEAVLAANEAGIAAVRAGIPAREVHETARAVLESRGLVKYFTHGLGHGVGLDVHERPTVGPKSHDALLAGSVVTIEPGVYVEGFGGVRIEDLVVVEEGGCRLLSHSPKALIEI